ncbi:MAG TPA: hypothetical protein VGC36_16770 [Rhizomicrobium sp.]
MQKKPRGPAACPSARAEAGATLIGVIGTDGRVAYLKTALEIDADFIAEASKDGPPEERFRFAGTCVEGKCVQWDGAGKRCGVLDGVIPYLGRGDADAPLQPCVIRGACRWYRQDGAAACRICPGVITQIA